MGSTEFDTSFDHLQRLPKAELIEVLLKTREERLAKEAEISKLIEFIRILKQKHFGKSSEKVSQEQLGLFNEAEAEVLKSSEPEEETVHVPAHDRKRGKRKPLPEDLPREDLVIELSLEERTCPNDGTVMTEIGENIAERLDVVPMQIKVIRTIRKKYGCCECEEQVKEAPVPPTAIPKSNASEGLLAFIITSKYEDHLPLYRMESIFERYGVDLPRNTMGRWMVQSGELVQPLINLLEEEVLSSKYLQMDETRVQVLKENGKRAESLSYMWVRARLGPDPIILFDYDPSRSSDVPVKLLEGFSGHLQVDGYDGYCKVCKDQGILRIGCFAHCRRKFFEASTATKKVGLANIGLKFIKKLYAIEDAAREKSFEKRFAMRKEVAKPILDEMRAWVTAALPTVPPKTALGRALSYTDNEWCYLIRYLEDGQLEIDNNYIENYIRPFALGRKNWLFSDTVEGAKASANLYSLISTARANGLQPYLYLRTVLEGIPRCKVLADFEALLPLTVKNKTSLH